MAWRAPPYAATRLAHNRIVSARIDAQAEQPRGTMRFCWLNRHGGRIDDAMRTVS